MDFYHAATLLILGAILGMFALAAILWLAIMLDTREAALKRAAAQRRIEEIRRNDAQILMTANLN